MTAVQLRPEHARLTRRQILDQLCRESVGVWAEEKLRYTNAPFHWEWYRLAETSRRLCIIAPREHAKSQTIAVNYVAHRLIHVPGIWVIVFAATLDQAEERRDRIVATVEAVQPDLLDGADKKNVRQIVLANGSRAQFASAGKAVRGAHPDIVIGDDVLEESKCLTDHQRRKTFRWWHGTVSGMAHPGTTRLVHGTERTFPPTQLLLIGTPFHASDLLMDLATNPQYRWRRYSAELPEQRPLAESWAVETGQA